MSRKGEASARASSRARTACGAAPEVASRRSATTEIPRHGPGRRPAPSTRASRSGRGEPAAGRPGAAGRGVAVLEQGQRLHRVAGDGPAEDGAGAVGRREAHLAAGAQGPGDLPEGDRGVVDDLEHVVAERQVVAAGLARGRWPAGPRAAGRRRPGRPRTRSPTPAVSARRRRVARASALGSTTVTSWPSRASGTANMPLPPPTSSTRSGVPAPTTGSSAAQTAAVRAGSCSAVGEAGDVGTCGSLVAGRLATRRRRVRPETPSRWRA